MEPSRRLFFISLGTADFVKYDQREVFFPTPFCQENVIIIMKAKQTRSRRQAEAGKNKRLFFFHFRGQFCFDLDKIRFLGCR